jgi:hypothetical protein
MHQLIGWLSGEGNAIWKEPDFEWMPLGDDIGGRLKTSHVTEFIHIMPASKDPQFWSGFSNKWFLSLKTVDFKNFGFYGGGPGSPLIESRLSYAFKTSETDLIILGTWLTPIFKPVIFDV